MNESTKEKEDFIRAQGIPFRVGEPVTELFVFAQIKARTKSTCFGFYDESDSECLNCYKKSACKGLTGHILGLKAQDIKNDPDILRITAMDGTPLDTVSIDAILDKIGFRSKESKSYLIAKHILSSDGKRIDVLQREIMAIIGPKASLKDVAVRISQVTARIHEYTDLRITREVVRFLKITREVKKEQ